MFSVQYTATEMTSVSDDDDQNSVFFGLQVTWVLPNYGCLCHSVSAGFGWNTA